MTNKLIDIDDARTWPASLATRVRETANRCRGQTRYTSDLPVKLEDGEEFRALLAGHLVRAFHFTRLLEHEADSIRRDGLKLLTADLLEQRLCAAHSRGHIRAVDADELRRGTTFTTRTEAHRENQVCLVLSRRMFEHDAHGLVPLMSRWGGEAMYSGPADDDDPRVRKIGLPSIVVAHVDLSPGPEQHMVFPTLEKLFVGTALSLGDVGGEVFYRSAIPGNHIEAIWQPGHPEFDRHHGLRCD